MKYLYWCPIIMAAILIGGIILGFKYLPAYESPDPDTQIIRQLEDINDNLKDIKELLGRLNDCCRSK